MDQILWSSAAAFVLSVYCVSAAAAGLCRMGFSVLTLVEQTRRIHDITQVTVDVFFHGTKYIFCIKYGSRNLQTPPLRHYVRMRLLRKGIVEIMVFYGDSAEKNLQNVNSDKHFKLHLEQRKRRFSNQETRFLPTVVTKLPKQLEPFLLLGY